MTTKVAETASGIADELDAYMDVEQPEIEQDLEELVDDYKVPLEEAERAVRNDLLDEHGISQRELNQDEAPAGDGHPEEFDPTPVEAIDTDGEWNDVAVDVVDLWEPSHPDMAQVGLLGDETDVIKFVIWENNGRVPVELLEEGESYEISNVVTEEYNGRYSVELNASSHVVQTDNTVVVEGVLAAVRPGSGLIKRCPAEDCTRVLQNNRCAEHGDAEEGGDFDLRIKAVIDDGAVAQNVVFDREATEAAVGMALEEAKGLAMDELDTSVVADVIEAEVLCQYYAVEGPRLGENVLVDEFSERSGPDEGLLQTLRERVETDDAEPAVDAEPQPSETAA
jgi:replication factor A1